MHFSFRFFRASHFVFSDSYLDLFASFSTSFQNHLILQYEICNTPYKKCMKQGKNAQRAALQRIESAN